MNIVSFGGGTNSTAMIIGMYLHKIPIDLILFADTGGEQPHTYKFIEIFNGWLEKHGRLWFQLAASALRTKDTDLQSWPTPTAMDAAGLARHLRKDATSTRSLLLCQKVAYLAGGVLEI